MAFLGSVVFSIVLSVFLSDFSEKLFGVFVASFVSLIFTG